MNVKNLERFHQYLCAVVAYYRAHRTLKNFSGLAKEFKVKAITRELFFQFDLDKLEGEPTREQSDKIRQVMSDMDIKRRQAQLQEFINEQEAAEKNEEDEIEEALDNMPSLLERFEEHMGKVNSYVSKITNAAWDAGRDLDINDVRFEPEGFDTMGMYDMLNLRDWSDQVEYEAAKSLFEKMDEKVLCDAIPKMGKATMHAFLTYIFGGENGVQLKFDFDARGGESPQNDAIEEALAEHGIFNDVLFHKLESWKGCGHMCIVYKDAPDVLMIIGDEKHDFYTVDDDVFYSYCGNTIIDPGNACAFGGWGTRSIMAECIKTIQACKQEAIEVQKSLNIDQSLKGKLMEDLKYADQIRAMYKEDWEKKGGHQ